MDPSRPLFLRLYAALLRLYPRGFRLEFGEEMAAVAADALAAASGLGPGAAAKLALRELGGLARGLAEEHWDGIQKRFFGRGGAMNATGAAGRRAEVPGRPTSWGGTLAGMLLFLLLGLDRVVSEVPVLWLGEEGFEHPFYTALHNNLFVAGLVVPAAGVCAGYILNFPRWSYPYAGRALVMSLYMSVVATPGLSILGYTFRQNELWGFRAWLPLGLAFLIGWAVTKSLHPLRRFFVNLWNDWTVIPFALFGFMPLYVAISFDEMDRLYSLVFMAAVAPVMVLTALAYLRSRTVRARAWWLAAGMAAAFLVCNAGSAAYYSGVNIETGFRVVATTLVLVGMAFAPGLAISLLKRAPGGLRGAG